MLRFHHTCDKNGINLLNTLAEADATSIQSINGTNYISMNDDENLIHKYYAPFYYQRIMKMYLSDQNMIHQNEDYVIIKILFWIYYDINQRILNGSYHWIFFVIDDTNISSRM